MAVRAEARYAITAEDRSRAAFASFNNQLALAGKGAKAASAKASGFFAVAGKGAKAAGKAAKFMAVGALGVVGVGVAAALGAKRLTSMTTASLESMAAINKLSKQTGLGVGFLSRFTHVAELTGASLGDVTGGIEDFSIKLGEAAREGKGAAHEAFRQLGLDAKKLDRMGMGQALLQTFNQLSRVRSEARRSSLVDELFAGDGWKMMNTISLGAEKIVSLMQEAQRLGIGFDAPSADKATKAMASAALLEAQMKGIGQDVSIWAAPKLTALYENFSKLVSEARGPGGIAGAVGPIANAMVTSGKEGLETIFMNGPMGMLIDAIKKAFSDDTEKTLTELREINRNTSQGNIAVAG